MSEKLEHCPFYEGVCGLNDSVVCYSDKSVCDLYKKAKKAFTDSPWRTGTPTEKGEHLVLWRDTQEGVLKKSVLLWSHRLSCWYDTQMGVLWGDEYHAEVVAWQRIEAYKA